MNNRVQKSNGNILKQCKTLCLLTGMQKYYRQFYCGYCVSFFQFGETLIAVEVTETNTSKEEISLKKPEDSAKDAR